MDATAPAPWTEEDDERLRKAYRQGGFREALIAFAGKRTKASIQTRAQKIGAVSQGRWTPGDIQQLRELISAGAGAIAIARELGRTEKAVVLKAARLDLLASTQGQHSFDNHDVNGLLKAPLLSEFLGAVDAGDSVSAVATDMGLSYRDAQQAVLVVRGARRDAIAWEWYELALLRRRYAQHSLAELAARFFPSRSKAAIAIKASSMGLTRDRRSAALTAFDRKRRSGC